MPLVQVHASVYEGPQPSQVVLHDHHVHRWKRRSKLEVRRAILRPLLYRSHALNAPHRRVVGLVDAGQGECVQQFELGHYVRPEDLRQLLRDGDEHRDLAATDLIGDRLDRAAHASSLHVAGCVATGSVVALFQKLSWCAFSRSEGCRAGPRRLVNEKYPPSPNQELASWIRRRRPGLSRIGRLAWFAIRRKNRRERFRIGASQATDRQACWKGERGALHINPARVEPSCDRLAVRERSGNPTGPRGKGAAQGDGEGETRGSPPRKKDSTQQPKGRESF